MLKVIAAAAAALTMLLGGPAPDRPKAEKPVASPEGICPQIYAPVICDHGKIYPNQCEADQHHAKNCVPYGI